MYGSCIIDVNYGVYLLFLINWELSYMPTRVRVIIIENIY